MRKLFFASFATVFTLAASLAFARDPIHDGKLEIKPAKDDHFEAAEYTLGKAELYGYVSDLKDTKKITGILLLRGDRATPNQKHLIAITAKAQQLEAFIDLDGKVQPLTDPTPSPETTPPPIDNAGAAATPTAATPAPTTPTPTAPATSDAGH
jgi:hypothetical protein